MKKAVSWGKVWGSNRNGPQDYNALKYDAIKSGVQVQAFRKNQILHNDLLW